MSDTELPSLPGFVFTDASEAPGNMPGLIGPSWQEQDALLRDLWIQNKTPQEISDILSRSVAAIMTRAARLGLPRRAAPGRKPGSRLMPENKQNTQISMTSPRPAVGSVPQEEGERVAQPSARICLMCLRSFQSQGRHNRICPSCKGSAEYGAAVALADIHFPV